jgi:hypothetical protein
VCTSIEQSCSGRFRSCDAPQLQQARTCHGGAYPTADQACWDAAISFTKRRCNGTSAELWPTSTCSNLQLLPAHQVFFRQTTSGLPHTKESLDNVEAESLQLSWMADLRCLLAGLCERRYMVLKEASLARDVGPGGPRNSFDYPSLRGVSRLRGTLQTPSWSPRWPPDERQGPVLLQRQSRVAAILPASQISTQLNQRMCLLQPCFIVSAAARGVRRDV